MSDDRQNQRQPDQPIVGKLVGGDEIDSGSEPEVQSLDVAMGADDVGALIDEELGEQAIAEIRVGSPFKVDPAPIAGTSIQRRRAKPEAFYDVGPLRYTAMGAVAAAMVVLGFAIAAAWWFPGGGTIIATLGCALSIFGLYSHKRLAAGACLMLYLLLFLISYTRAIQV